MSGKQVYNRISGGKLDVWPERTTFKGRELKHSADFCVQLSESRRELGNVRR